MGFLQDAPQLTHPYRHDGSLWALLDRVLSTERRAALDAAPAVDRECPSPDAECLIAGVDTETVGAECAPVGGDEKAIDGDGPIPGGEW
jgi:hypothetical protein